MNAGEHAPHPPGLSIEHIQRGGELTLTLRGEFELDGMERFDRATAEITPGTAVTVDLSEVSFLDSSGLRCLMNLDLRGRAEGFALVLRSPQPHVLRTFRLCGFDQRLTIVEADTTPTAP